MIRDAGRASSTSHRGEYYTVDKPASTRCRTTRPVDRRGQREPARPSSRRARRRSREDAPESRAGAVVRGRGRPREAALRRAHGLLGQGRGRARAPRTIWPHAGLEGPLAQELRPELRGRLRDGTRGRRRGDGPLRPRSRRARRRASRSTRRRDSTTSTCTRSAPTGRLPRLLRARDPRGSCVTRGRCARATGTRLNADHQRRDRLRARGQDRLGLGDRLGRCRAPEEAVSKHHRQDHRVVSEHAISSIVRRRPSTTTRSSS